MGAIKFAPTKKYLTFTEFIIIFINRILQSKGVILVSKSMV